MNTMGAMKSIGMSDGEITVYLSLLNTGPARVSKIKEDSNLHRTTIYDFIEKLMNRGLVSHVVEKNVKLFKAAPPEKLLDYTKELQAGIQFILPHLMKIANSRKDDISVEVFRGNEGLKTILNDVIRERQDFIGFGLDEKMFNERYPHLMKQHFKKELKVDIKGRLLTNESASFVFRYKNLTYRYIPDKFFNPTPTIVYSDKVVILIWKPFSIILIKSFDLADSYRKHFEILWESAGETSRIS